ncbi:MULTISPECIES: hypothetical protein [Enterobacter cloacae complex]|uniref:hypothetical protein n=1 Tax=Enterobacter cloacae complex TaxID=354276 RepID=UPI0010122046|nr:MULTISPECIES: hypothetical protein [Enterobacter cloacae complex]MBW7764107.1 hypothetical protein [Enterobacter hormaechei]MCW4734446.1 hypothetical protein [Enterobacter hormaechei subsp. xiangfangensis]MDQ6582950.1 hypothetical protein [Enterobacter hormaechei]MDQ6593728.1 hypothetical protein [Enterobacter hormaechei]RYA41361.1 hypothetical protein DD605_14460 [Enterobacter cloacae complex sp. 3DZ3S2B]
MTFTKEQLIAAAVGRIEMAEEALANDLVPLARHTFEIDLELARIALASLEAEAVGEVVLGEFDDAGCHPDARVACIAADGQADWENFKDGTRLYTAPPAQVSVPDAIHSQGEKSASDDYYALVWNACRAAMLQGADGNAPAHFRSRPAQSSLSPAQGGNSPVIPDGWVMVPRMLTPRMITKLQQKTEIGSYIAANWAGAYDLFQKFWDEAIAAAPQQEVK